MQREEIDLIEDIAKVLDWGRACIPDDLLVNIGVAS
jgi:hypothetical protein